MMTKFFPWQIFRKVYFFYFVLQTLLCFGLATILWGDSVWKMSLWNDLTLSAHSVVIFGVFNFVGALMIGLWLVLSFLLPLRQAILKVRSIANKKFRNSLDILNLEEIKIEDLGEFSVLENQLNEIYRKLRKKNDKIAREKEELNALMSSISDSILAVDRHSKLLFYNERFRAHFLDRDFLKGEIEIQGLQQNRKILLAYDRALAEGKSSHIEFDAEIQSGEVREFSVSIAPLYQRKNDSGNIYGAIGVFHDITEVRLTQQIKTEFVSNASHELRTPLTSLKGYVLTLREDVENGRYDDVAKFASIIDGNVDRLVELTNDLLTISRLENSGATVKMDLVSLDEINRQVEADTVDMLTKKGHKLTFDNMGNDSIVCDKIKAQQVLMNLVSNAIKYMPEPGEIDVRWQMQNAEMVLSVKDNGPGIAAEHLSRIFERFYRIDKGRARTDGGTGLGLAIVKHIVNSHGGTVQVSSELNQGTKFECRFPQSLTSIDPQRKFDA